MGHNTAKEQKRKWKDNDNDNANIQTDMSEDGQGGSTGNYMARKWAQDLPRLRLHEQQRQLRGARKTVSKGVIELTTIYSRELDGLGDLELPAQGMQTLEQRLQESH